MVFWAEPGLHSQGLRCFREGAIRGCRSPTTVTTTRSTASRRLPPEVGFPPGAVFRAIDQFEQTVDILATKYNHRCTDPADSVGGDVSYARRVGKHCAGCHSRSQGPDFDEKANHGHQLIGDFRFGLHMIPAHTVLIGVEARKVDAGDHVDELGLRLGPASSWSINTASRRSTSRTRSRSPTTASHVGGVRYDAKSDLFDDKLSPRIAVVYNPSTRLVLRGGWSTAFRFPNFSELYQNSWFFGVESPFGSFPVSRCSSRIRRSRPKRSARSRQAASIASRRRSRPRWTFTDRS